MPFSAKLSISLEISTASNSTFKSGRAERMDHRIEYTSAPMLQPKTVILNVAPWGLWPARRRINSSAGRFLRKNVPKNCWRLAPRQTKLCNQAPYERTPLRFRRREGGG